MARSNPLWPSAPGAILRYAVALLAVAAAAVVGLLLDRFLQTAPTVSLFLCAVLFAAWFGGAGKFFGHLMIIGTRRPLS